MKRVLIFVFILLVIFSSFFVVFSAPTTYTIVFDGNGSTSGSTAPVTVTYGTVAAFTPNGFNRTGYEFIGWYMQRASDKKWVYVDQSGARYWREMGQEKAGEKIFLYQDKATVSTSSAVDNDIVTCFAQWELNSSPPSVNSFLPFDLFFFVLGQMKQTYFILFLFGSAAFMGCAILLKYLFTSRSDL